MPDTELTSVILSSGCTDLTSVKTDTFDAIWEKPNRGHNKTKSEQDIFEADFKKFFTGAFLKFI